MLENQALEPRTLVVVAHSRGFEPLTSAFGGQRSIHTRFARGWLLRTPTLSKLIEYIKILAEFECLSIGTGGTFLSLRLSFMELIGVALE